MAHTGEAQGVIEKFKMTKIQPDLFKTEDMVLLITGEGPIEAATKTALTIPAYNITSVTNIGIAGSLSPELKKGDLVKVRTLYLIQDFKPAYKTFNSFDEGFDCLTSFERVLDPEKARVLKGIGHLVDREAWGVAMAAKTGGIPFSCYKLISDIAGTPEACELVKESAEELSEKIATELMRLRGKETDEEQQLEGFHFTFTMRHRFKTLLQKLTIKEDETSEYILSSLPLEELRTQEISPKERARRLLDLIEDRIDPFRKKLQLVTDKLQDCFREKGFKIYLDPNFENPKVTIQIEAESDAELRNKAKDLEGLSIEPYRKIMNGEFNVE